MIEARLDFDAATHSVDAVQRAAYRLGDQASCQVDQDAGRVFCRVFVESEDPAQLGRAVAALRNHVIDQVLRERVRAETEGVRNAIFALAFSNTGLTSPE